MLFIESSLKNSMFKFISKSKIQNQKYKIIKTRDNYRQIDH